MLCEKWKIFEDLGLHEYLSKEWQCFTCQLEVNILKLYLGHDNLVWSFNLVNGSYIDKLGYTSLFAQDLSVGQEWQWRQGSNKVSVS